MVETRYVVVEIEGPGEESIGRECRCRSTVGRVMEDSGDISGFCCLLGVFRRFQGVEMERR
jgi:hypothetical protein